MLRYDGDVLFVLPSPSLKHKLSDGEIKEELPASDYRAIQEGVEILKEYDADFKRNHFTVVELANEEELEAEQAVLDEHTKRVTDFWIVFRSCYRNRRKCQRSHKLLHLLKAS